MKLNLHILFYVLVCSCFVYITYPGSKLINNNNKKIKSFPSSLLLETNQLLIPKSSLPPKDIQEMVGGGDPDSIGLNNFYKTLIFSQMKPTDRVLEIGCGWGRNARFFSNYLSQGVWCGFDIVDAMISWAKSNIEKPNMKFQLANVYNEHYIKSGNVQSASTFVFPYENDFFDVIYLPSVFTHLSREDYENYLKESSRVLKDGGLIVMWFFIKRDYQCNRINLTQYNEVTWSDYNIPEQRIVFSESYIRNSLTKFRFKYVNHELGHWCNDVKIINYEYQDIVIAVNVKS